MQYFDVLSGLRSWLGTNKQTGSEVAEQTGLTYLAGHPEDSVSHATRHICQ